MTESSQTGRIAEIDIIKAFAIVMMVWGHIGLPCSRFFYLFHMAVFFICSGIVYKEKYAESFSSVVTFTKNKLRTLYVPYVCCAILFTLLNNVFLKIGFYAPDVCPYLSGKRMLIDCVRALCFVRGTQLSGATWFLHALFFISEFYVFFDYVLHRMNARRRGIIQLIFSAVLFMALFASKRYWQSHKSIYDYVSHFILGYTVFCIGVNAAKLNILPKLKSASLWMKLLVCMVSFVVLVTWGSRGGISILEGKFVNPLYFYFMSVSGFLFCFCMALLFVNAGKITTVLLIIGRNTMPILLWHLLFFKFMNLFYVSVFGLDKSLVSAFPTFYRDMAEYTKVVGGGYLCIGVILPVAINLMKRRLIAVRKERRHD